MLSTTSINNIISSASMEWFPVNATYIEGNREMEELKAQVAALEEKVENLWQATNIRDLI